MLPFTNSDLIFSEKEFFCYLMDQIDFLIYHSHKEPAEVSH
jgi:hypothetical protein